MPDIPPAAILAAAAAIERELMSGTDYSMAADSDEALARVALEAAAPILAAAWGVTGPLSKEQVRSVACPSCGAGAGEQCRVQSYGVSRTWPTIKLHAGRRHAAAATTALRLELPDA